jgi:hypothetical protein
MTTPTREQVVRWLEMAGIPQCVSPIDRATQIMAATKIVTIARADLEATISELTAEVGFWINSRNELQQADDAIIADQAKEIERLQEHSTYVDRQNLQLGRELAELTAQRDEAMAALESIAACPGDNRLSTAIQWAKAAIAKCKEGK